MKLTLLISLLLITSTSFSQEKSFDPFEITGSFFDGKGEKFEFSSHGGQYRAISYETKRGLEIKVNGEWKKHGRWMYFEKSTFVKGVYIAYEMEHYKFGVLHGEYERWNNSSSDGIQKPKRKCTYIDGLKEGKYLNYHHSGSLEEEGEYINGKREGQFIRYMDNDGKKEKGPKKYIVDWKNDMQYGYKIGYNRDGVEITRSKWENDKRVD
jgi:hypothetical protein